MIEYVLDHLAAQGVCPSSRQEQEQLEAGIARYLLENGIEETDTGAYYKQYVSRHLQIVSVADWKAYFINYPLISDVRQIAIEYHAQGALPEGRRRTLYQLMEKLHACGLGEKYIPREEVKQILGKLS